MADHETAFQSLDGTALFGTVCSAEAPVGMAVLVHGSGVTREEGGFFTRLAAGLAASGVTSLRFDLRAHGASGGRESELTIASVTNDVRAAGDHLRAHTGRPGPVHVIAASFSGGAAALHAAHRPDDVDKLVLLNVWQNEVVQRVSAFLVAPAWITDPAAYREVLAVHLDAHGPHLVPLGHLDLKPEHLRRRPVRPSTEASSPLPQNCTIGISACASIR